MQHNKSNEFLEVYEKHLNGREVKRLLEVGVQRGGSLDIWRGYFPDAEIVGLDNDPRCGSIKGVVIGDQKDYELLESLGRFDVVIDDGGHKMSQQQGTFDLMFRNLHKGGLYVIEDLHTSYWEEFLDGRPTIDFLKDLIDDLHSYATDSPRCKTGVKHENRYEITGLHIYPGIVFIEK